MPRSDRSSYLGAVEKDTIEECLDSSWTEWEEVVHSQVDFRTPQPLNSILFQEDFDLFSVNPKSKDPNTATTLLTTGTVEAPMLVMAVSFAYYGCPAGAAIPGVAVAIPSPGPSDVPVITGPPGPLPNTQNPAWFEKGEGWYRAFNSWAATRLLEVKQGRCVLLQTNLADIGFYRQELWRGWSGDVQLPLKEYINKLNDQILTAAAQETTVPFPPGLTKQFLEQNAETTVDGAVPLFPPGASVSVGSAQINGYGGSSRVMKVLSDPFLLVPGTPINARVEKETNGIFDQDVISEFGPPQNWTQGQKWTANLGTIGQATSWTFKFNDFGMALLLYGFYVTPRCATRYLELAYGGHFSSIARGAYKGLQLPIGSGIEKPKNAE